MTRTLDSIVGIALAATGSARYGKSGPTSGSRGRHRGFGRNGGVGDGDGRVTER